MFPITVPGGKPVTEAAGHAPTSPVTTLEPVLVTFGLGIERDLYFKPTPLSEISGRS
jgi:hypothetical protein